MRRAWTAAALAAAALATQAPAQSPLADLGTPEGAVEALSAEEAAATYALPIGRYRPDGAEAERLTGRVTRRVLHLDAEEASVASVIEGYRRRLVDAGYRIVWSCTTEVCGGFDFRFSVELMPAPEMVMDSGRFAQLSARNGTGRAADAVSVLASEVAGRIYVQTVAVRPDPEAVRQSPRPPVPPADGAAAAEGAEGETRQAGPARDPGASSAPGTLLETLRREGHVRVDGLDFETGGAQLSASSDAMLDRLAAMLTENPDLAVVIVGHSDATGGLEPNIALSRRRAQAVRAALEARGVAKGRLEAEGAGYLAPVASNATAEGRALNRRVELVLK